MYAHAESGMFVVSMEVQTYVQGGQTGTKGGLTIHVRVQTYMYDRQGRASLREGEILTAYVNRPTVELLIGDTPEIRIPQQTGHKFGCSEHPVFVDYNP